MLAGRALLQRRLRRTTALRGLASRDDDDGAPPTRQRLLLGRKAKAAGPSVAVKALGGGGAVHGLSGLGVLGHAHLEEMTAAVVALASSADVVGGALVGGSAAAFWYAR